MGTEFLARIGEVASAALTRAAAATDELTAARQSADAAHRGGRALRDADIARHLEHLRSSAGSPRARWRSTAMRFDRLQRFAARRAAAAARGADASRAPLGGAAARRRPGAAQHRAHAVGLARLLSLARRARAWSPPTRSKACARRAPPSRCRRRLSVDHAVALVGASRRARRSPALAARDACIVELLYGCGLRVGELVGLDVVASAAARPAGSTPPTPAPTCSARAASGAACRWARRRSQALAGVAGAARRRWRAPASRRSSSAAAARG